MYSGPTLSLKRISEDAAEGVQYLRQRYSKDKVFVIDFWGKPEKDAKEREIKHMLFLKYKEDATPEDIKDVEFSWPIGMPLHELGRQTVERRIVAHPRAKTGWDSLTDSELKVVNLIAQGATNRDVATELHLSPHTVKTHVHNAFAKLGITSRTQLTQLMGGAQ